MHICIDFYHIFEPHHIFSQKATTPSCLLCSVTIQQILAGVEVLRTHATNKILPLYEKGMGSTE